MDYVSIVKQLVLLDPSAYYSYKNAWPEGIEFPLDWGDFVCDINEKAVYTNGDCFFELGGNYKHGAQLFKPLEGLVVRIGCYENGEIDTVSTNTGFCHKRVYWQDFDYDNPTVPEILNKAMTIIHGKNWMKNIPTEITYIAPRKTSFIKTDKL